MTRRLIIILTLSCLVLACASDPSNDSRTRTENAAPDGAPSYSASVGEKPVGVIPDATLRDGKRQKDLDMSIEYPIAAGSYPLIVWSHGFGSSSRGYVGISSYWASRGYVVIKPTHADSARMQGMRAMEDVWESQSSSDWRNRVQDVTFILDSVAQLEEKYPELKGKIDTANVGVGGHSYGAYTAMLIGGVKTFPGGTSYADPRVKAVMAISPQGPSEQRHLTAESFATLTVPTLFMTGTLDRGVSEAETPEWRRKAFELSPAGDKILVVLEGARHATFTGRIAGMVEEGSRSEDIVFPTFDPGLDPRVRGGYVLPPAGRRDAGGKRDAQLNERAIFARVKVITVAYWDAYLHGNAKGREFLNKLDARLRVESVRK